ncbi:MAG: Asp-tRNA(Asn)/Glu-tRNA(Gln) amidotransferase subunit GatB [Gallionellaceae bacterium]
MQWEIVIGLEVHAQLSTSSKIFCGASTAFGAAPNTQADAVSLALPGVLPVLNKGAVERAIKFGLATGAHIAQRSVFARKNYFYPDLPKGYQISQFDLPVVGNGQLTIHVPACGKTEAYETTVRITRAHLEEDAGKSIHGSALSGVAGLGVAGLMVAGKPLVDEYRDLSRLTGVDLNRAGTPLLEIVSEPDMSSAAEAVAYAKKLHELVCWNGICDGNMQEGSFRCDVNVSVRRPGAPLGTRREIKNLNSFKFMQQAIDYEVQWQIDTIENGGKIHQATVLFDPDKGTTHAMRSKEEAHDYRYFPDPDLLPLDITPAMLEQARATLPEQPEVKRARYIGEYGLSAYDANGLTASRAMAEFFEACMSTIGTNNAKLCVNWLMGEVAARLNREGKDIVNSPIAPGQLADVLLGIIDGRLNNTNAKVAFDEAWNAPPVNINASIDKYRIVNASVGSYSWSGTTAVISNIIEEKGLKQVSDTGAIEKIVDEIIAANPAQVAEYRSGKEKVFGFFVGLAMKASKGKANPAQLNEVLKRRLAG